MNFIVIKSLKKVQFFLRKLNFSLKGLLSVTETLLLNHYLENFEPLKFQNLKWF